MSSNGWPSAVTEREVAPKLSGTWPVEDNPAAHRKPVPCLASGFAQRSRLTTPRTGRRTTSRTDSPWFRGRHPDSGQCRTPIGVPPIAAAAGSS